MSRRRDAHPVAAFAAVLAAVSGLARGAAPPADDAAPAPEAVIEDYLSERGLTDLLTAHLRQRLEKAAGADRVPIAERLGRLYVERLGKATTADARRELDKQSRELLKTVPEADSFELRIDLAKASFLQAEEIAQRDRLRMASADEKQEAERLLRAVSPMFAELAGKLNRKVEGLERRESTGRDEEATKEELAEARRLRSLTMYYTGWTNYYLATLTSNAAFAVRALEDFGYILNAAEGKAASVERLPKPLLKYEHVARAAVGCALCAALRPGGDVEAVRWLDAVESAEDAAPQVAEQLFANRVAVLASAKRWADLDLYVRRRLRPGLDGSLKPLTPVEARLLAIATLEGLDAAKSTGRSAEIVEALAQVALGELVTQGHVGHVLDLVQRYGTAPIGQDGFIVQYVRGFQAYERSRAEHQAAGAADSPAPDPGLANRYREAAQMLEVAVATKDAPKYQAERVRAGMKAGLAWFYAGEFKSAAEQLLKSVDMAEDPAQKQEAMWRAIVALDFAVEQGKRELSAERDRVATLFLGAYPKSPNAPLLLLRRAGAGLVPDEQTLKILADVGPTSPLYPVARRQIAEIHFRQYRRASASDRATSAARFLQLGGEALELGLREIAEAKGGTPATDLVEGALRTARQVAEVAMAVNPPDLIRAEAALGAIAQIDALVGFETSSIEDEVTYRRLQIAVERGRAEEIAALIAKLQGHPGPFAQAADRLVLKSAMDEWTASPSVGTAERVVQVGARVVDQAWTKPGAAEDPSTLALTDSVAEAAARVWRDTSNAAARDLAIRLDSRLSAAVKPPATSLRRLAELSEAAGDSKTALESWRRLLAGLPSDQTAWFEARYHSLRLLMTLDPAAAAEAMAQHKVLNPEFGPEPWGSKLRELDSRMPPSAPVDSSEPANPGPEAGGGAR